MTSQELAEVLDELLEKINDSHISMLKQIDQHPELEQFREVIVKLGESLDTLRLTVKYLCFDLEATSRELDQLHNTSEDDNIPF